MVYVMAKKITITAQKIVTLLVSVMMVLFLTVLMTIAVQNHGLAMDLKTVKIRHMAVT
tara:strand:+ start:829 stop:1002 length:174 start_codon:yes stop_codon:yes gene_type:complete